MREARRVPTPLIRIDPGWLFLVSGVVLVGAMVLLSAGDDLDRARDQRNRVLAQETQANQRLERAAEYLHALEEGDERLLRSLAAIQMNLTTPDRRALWLDASIDASVFPALEPDPMPSSRSSRSSSLLTRLATDETARLWVIALGLVSILYGILPIGSDGSRRYRSDGERTVCNSAA